jgi:23S rRNA pseudouridine1911/1915/1917 synthase
MNSINIICDENRKIKLDEFLYQNLNKDYLGVVIERKEITRSQVILAIKSSRVKVNGVVVNKRHCVLKNGDNVEYIYNVHMQFDLIPAQMKLNIIFEDDDILVLNKPVGAVVHPAAGNWDNTILNGVLYYLEEKNGKKLESDFPVAINRLDKNTSGVLFIAKNINARMFYAEQFEKRSVHKEYIAAVPERFATVFHKYGNNSKLLSVVGFIDRHKIDRKIMQLDDMNVLNYSLSTDELLLRLRRRKIQKGRFADTEILSEDEYIFPGENYTNYRIVIRTGRKHQIRATFKALGFPILGDAPYGGDEFSRLMLHSLSTEITLKSGEKKIFVADLPREFVTNAS